MTNSIKTSELLSEILKGKNQQDRITFSEINNFLHERGFGLLLLLFSFPMAIPMPYPPGFTTVLGIPLIFYALQMIMAKKDAWIPKWIGNKTIKVEHLQFAITKATRFFKFIETIVKPRLDFMTGKNGERVIGFFVMICAIAIALPIPLGNAVPSLGIFIMSIGLLNKDGLIVMIGMIVSVFGIAIASTVVIFGVKVVTSLFAKFYIFIKTIL